MQDRETHLIATAALECDCGDGGRRLAGAGGRLDGGLFLVLALLALALLLVAPLSLLVLLLPPLLLLLLVLLVILLLVVLLVLLGIFLLV